MCPVLRPPSLVRVFHLALHEFIFYFLRRPPILSGCFSTKNLKPAASVTRLCLPHPPSSEVPARTTSVEQACCLAEGPDIFRPIGWNFLFGMFGVSITLKRKGVMTQNPPTIGGVLDIRNAPYLFTCYPSHVPRGEICSLCGLAQVVKTLGCSIPFRCAFASLAAPAAHRQHHLHHPHQRLPRMRMMQVMLGMLPMLVNPPPQFIYFPLFLLRPFPTVLLPFPPKDLSPPFLPKSFSLSSSPFASLRSLPPFPA